MRLKIDKLKRNLILVAVFCMILVILVGGYIIYSSYEEVWREPILSRFEEDLRMYNRGYEDMELKGRSKIILEEEGTRNESVFRVISSKGEVICDNFGAPRTLKDMDAEIRKVIFGRLNNSIARSGKEVRVIMALKDKSQVIGVLEKIYRIETVINRRNFSLGIFVFICMMTLLCEVVSIIFLVKELQVFEDSNEEEVNGEKRLGINEKSIEDIEKNDVEQENSNEKEIHEFEQSMNEEEKVHKNEINDGDESSVNESKEDEDIEKADFSMRNTEEKSYKKEGEDAIKEKMDMETSKKEEEDRIDTKEDEETSSKQEKGSSSKQEELVNDELVDGEGNMIEVNIPDIYENVLENVSDEIFDKGISIQNEFESSIKAICKPVRIREIIEYFLRNAILYSFRGGVISVVMDENEYGAAILIRDNGCGISEEKLRVLRNDNDNVGSKFKVIEKKIKEMKGKLYINSIEGEGTEIIINLPKK